MIEPGKIVELTIDSLAHGGAGVGRLNDFVFFIPFTVPGDFVRIQVTETKKNYAEAKLLELIKSGPTRIAAPCQAFGKCGGCQWQNVSYKEQLNQKQKTVEHTLSRIAKESDFLLKSIIPSPQEFFYRNRAQVRTQGSRVGFYRRGSHEIVEFDECHILEKPLNQEIQKIKFELKDEHPEKTSKIEIFLDQTGAVLRSQNKGHGEETGFAQVNTKQNTQMQSYILELFGRPVAENSLLDLYCGNGNFSLPLAQNGWDVYGIDSSRSAIHAARKQAATKSYFSCDDCSSGLRKLLQKNRRFKKILLDPPRVGADERLLKQLGMLGADTLVYVSCNPATFARDWARIKNNSDFKLVSVQPFDMFPQTFHVELVALATC